MAGKECDETTNTYDAAEQLEPVTLPVDESYVEDVHPDEDNLRPLTEDGPRTPNSTKLPFGTAELMLDGSRTVIAVTVPVTFNVKGRQAPTTVAAEPHGCVSSAAVIGADAPLETPTWNESPDESVSVEREPSAGTLAETETTLVLLPKQDSVPAGQSAVPGKKSQQKPFPARQGPGVPKQPSHTAWAGAGRVKSEHSRVPAGQRCVPATKPKHMDEGC